MYTAKSFCAICKRKASKRWDVLTSLFSGKQSDAASRVNTDPLREPLGEVEPERFLFKLILFAMMDDRLFVRDNKPGEHVQLAQSALLTLLLATLIGLGSFRK